MYALLRDRRDLAPQLPHRVAVEAPGALEQLRGIDEVGRPALVHVHLEVGEAAAEHPGGARVVEVDVRQQQGPGRAASKSLQQRLDARGGPRVDDHAVHLVGADDPIPSQVHDVDCTGQSDPTIQFSE